MGKRLKLEIDRAACCGYTICADICPEVYKLDSNSIVEEYHDVVPTHLEEKAREGADACPQNAIVVVEIDD